MDKDIKFSIEIRLGNAAMQTGNDIVGALKKVIDDLYSEYGSRGIHQDPRPYVEILNHNYIRDYNGNTVGEWELVQHDPKR